MTIEELEQKLNECQKALAEIQKEITELNELQIELKESKKEGKWKPQIGEEYWFKNDIGKVSHTTYMCSVDECRANNVPLFKTQEECERYWHFMDTVKEKSYEFSELDWRDDDIKKWVIEYDYLTNQLRASDHRYIKHFGLVYFKNEADAKHIIDNFKEELLEYWL